MGTRFIICATLLQVITTETYGTEIAWAKSE